MQICTSVCNNTDVGFMSTCFVDFKSTIMSTCSRSRQLVFLLSAAAAGVAFRYFACGCRTVLLVQEMARTRIKRQRLNAVISIRWHYGVSVSTCFALMTSCGGITLLLLAFCRCVSWLVQILRGNLQFLTIFPPTMLNANLRCKLYNTISGALHSFKH